MFDWLRSMTEGLDAVPWTETFPQMPDMLLPVFDGVTGILLLIALPLFCLELVRLCAKRRLTRRRGSGMLTSAFCFVPATVVEVLLGGALVGVFFWVGSLSPWTIPSNWATAALCLLLVDFAYYWEHRLGHEVNLLWSLYHSVHHSADHFDQTVALRVSFVDFFFSPLIYLPLVFAGFHPFLVFACYGLLLAWQQWIHTELVGRLPLLDPWLNTPSNHRVHHARNAQYLDKNYGGMLMVWDRLFGSYASENEAVDYGLVEPLVSRNPLAVHFHVSAKLVRTLASAPSLGAALRWLIRRPAPAPYLRTALATASRISEPRKAATMRPRTPWKPMSKRSNRTPPITAPTTPTKR